MKNHYVYEIRYPNGKGYIGMRSCKTSIEDDYRYTGSGKYIPFMMRKFGFKVILSTHSTREGALAEEVRLHKLFNIKDNINFYNKANQTSTKFNPSNEARQKISSKLKGRRAKDFEYIRKANEKRKRYVGDNQTPAQKRGNIIQGLKQRGVKNPNKGRSGTQNNGFKPWFYITPDNDYFEINAKTKQELVSLFNVSFRQLLNRFHYTNINKRASLTDGRVPEGLRGYVFGNL